MSKISRRITIARMVLQIKAGTHVAVPIGLLETLAYAGLVSYGPAWGGDETTGLNAGQAATNILNRYRAGK